MAPSSATIGRSAIAARMPPHGPAEYVTMPNGLYPKLLPPKLSSMPSSAGGAA